MSTTEETTTSPTPTPRRPRSIAAATSTGSGTPTDRLLTAALVVGPLLYLVVDTLYAARGWDDPLAGGLHVFGAVAYGVVVLRIATWLPVASWLRAVIVLVGLCGLAGNAAYGFDTIHVSLGDLSLVDQPGAANLIKPFGLLFPLSLLLVSAALARLGRRWQALVVGLAGLAWPVGHIGNVAVVAVLVNVALVVGFGSLVWAVGRDR